MAGNVLRNCAQDYEIIIVNDGSTDSTGKIAQRLAAGDSHLRVVHHCRNRGYGAALISGFRAAEKELIFYTDGDCQFDTRELALLLPLIEESDVVSAYRLGRQDPLLRRIYSRLYGISVRLLFGLRVRDVNCAFKLYKKPVVAKLSLRSQGAAIDAEMLIKAQRAGAKVSQVGVQHYPRQKGKQTGGTFLVMWRALGEIVDLWRELKREERRTT